MYEIDYGIRLSDIIGYLIGCSAILITLWVVVKQNKISENFERLRKSTISFSLEKIIKNLERFRNEITDIVDSMKKIRDWDYLPMGGKTKMFDSSLEINETMKHIERHKARYSSMFEEILKEITFLRGQIDPQTIIKIENLTHSINLVLSDHFLLIEPVYDDDDEGNFTYEDIWKSWQYSANKSIKDIQDALKEIQEIKSPAKKSKFKAKNYQ